LSPPLVRYFMESYQKVQHLTDFDFLLSVPGPAGAPGGPPPIATAAAVAAIDGELFGYQFDPKKEV
jgi:hypothetical protein